MLKKKYYWKIDGIFHGDSMDYLQLHEKQNKNKDT
jgi:hypothetical protein